jgi:membrane-associated phospholipid phosphatase
VADAESTPVTWRAMVESLNQPYRVPRSLVVLVSLVPGYLVIGQFLPGRAIHAPELPLDRLLPVEPVWALVYGTLYLFLIILPVFVVRQDEHIRRTVRAYLLVWLTAYACFLAYPTAAPRPAAVMGDGFAVWGLRFLYSADPVYNCFPSLHVAHSFVSALTCYRTHRKLGVVGAVCASLVAVSTLLAKQHYVLDVLAGVGLAGLSYVVFLRGFPRDSVPERERRLAPAFALATAGIVTMALACFWVAYRLGLS